MPAVVAALAEERNFFLAGAPLVSPNFVPESAPPPPPAADRTPAPLRVTKDTEKGNARRREESTDDINPMEQRCRWKAANADVQATPDPNPCLARARARVRSRVNK